MTPSEIQKQRLDNPYYGIAEQQALSLADMKRVSLANASIVKKRQLDPGQASAEEKEVNDPLKGMTFKDDKKGSLWDLAKSSIFESQENLIQLAHGDVADTGEAMRIGDIRAGITPEERQEFQRPGKEVKESLAKGDWLGAIAEVPEAILPTLAGSVGPMAEIALGALATRFGGKRLAGKVVAQKAEQALESAGNLVDTIEKGLSAGAKAASQVAVAAADMTQRSRNESFEKHGVVPDFGESAAMYAIHTLTLGAQPTIIKNLFVPQFKTQIMKEAKTIGKNIIGGSNLKQVGSRLGEMTLNVSKAAGAEAAQEYVQTWGEAFASGMGPEQRKDFWNSVMKIIGDEDNILESKIALLLGGGAGGGMRAATAVPATAAGIALDTTKGTVKTAAKYAKKVGSEFAAAQSLKVLSQEDRDAIASSFESEKAVLEELETSMQDTIEKSRATETLEELIALDPEKHKALVAGIRQERNFSDADMKDPKVLFQIKSDIINTYEDTLRKVRTDLFSKPKAAAARRIGKNLVSKTVENARKVASAVSPGWDAIKSTTLKGYDKAIKAGENIRSSTALGMIELSVDATAETTKTILEASRSLSMDDLQRVQAVISDINPTIAAKLDREISKKERAMQTLGLRSKDRISLKEASAETKSFFSGDKVDFSDPRTVAQASANVGTFTAKRVSDIETVEILEKLLNKIKQSKPFKETPGEKGVMSETGFDVIKLRLKQHRERIERDLAEEAKSAIGKAVDKVVKKVTPAAKKAAELTKAGIEKTKSEGKKLQEQTDKLIKEAEEKAEEKSKTKLAEKSTPQFVATTGLLSSLLQDPKKREKAIEFALDFIPSLKQNGIENRSDLVTWLKQNPTISDSVEFVKVLETDPDFQTNIIANEVFDGIATFTNRNVDNVKKMYNDINFLKGCKIP